MKRKLILGVVLLVILVAIFGVLPMSVAKRTIPSDAIKIVEVDVIRQPSEFVASGGCAATSTTIFSNTTAKKLTLKLLGVQAGLGNWTNIEAGYFTAVPFAIGPHGLAYEYPRFAALSPRPWRFRLQVCEEVTGAERTILAGQIGVRRFVSRIQHHPFWSPAVNGTTYFGHRTEMIAGEDRDWPKIAGDPSVR
jgi:hypothetical protein